MIKYFLHISRKIAIVLLLFWLVCYIVSVKVPDEWSNIKPVGNYWLNEDTSKLLQIKSFNYDTHLIEYRDYTPVNDTILQNRFYVPSKETDIMNSDIDYYELYEYYHD